MGEFDNIHWPLSVHLLRSLVLVAAFRLVGPERRVNRILDKIDWFNAVSWKNCHKSDPNSKQTCMCSVVCNKYLTNSFSSVWGFLVKIFNNHTSATALRSYSAALTSGYKRNILLMIISQVCKMHRIFKRVFTKLNNKQCRKTVVYRYKQPKQAHMKYNLGCWVS